MSHTCSTWAATVFKTHYTFMIRRWFFFLLTKGQVFTLIFTGCVNLKISYKKHPQSAACEKYTTCSEYQFLQCIYFLNITVQKDKGWGLTVISLGYLFGAREASFSSIHCFCLIPLSIISSHINTWVLCKSTFFKFSTPLFNDSLIPFITQLDC